MVETRLVCPTGVADRTIEREPPTAGPGAIVEANEAGDAWIDEVIAWGGRAWTLLAGDQDECKAAKAAQ